MLTNKNCSRRPWQYVLLALLSVWLAGCTPAGPRALLNGKRLLDQGQYDAAVEQLKLATSLLRTNALAWNYLGLAYHHAGQPANAVVAYETALKLNHDLVTAHYNLGCLLLEQNRLEDARNELTAYVLHRSNSPEGWLKLGAAELRLGEIADAEKSLDEAVRLAPQNPEALNDLGIIQKQRNRYRDAISYFNAALRQQPDYAPALLNLAVVLQSYPNSRPLALQKFRAYLALTPRPANWEAVNAIARQLDVELSPPPPVHAGNNNVATAENSAGNAANTENGNAARPAATAANPLKNESVSNHQRAVTSAPANESAYRPEVVAVPAAPVVRPAEDVVSATPKAAANASGPGVEPSAPEPTLDEPPKRGFFKRINPLNLFHRESKPIATPAPLPPVVLVNPEPAKPVPVYTKPAPVSKIASVPPPQAAPSLARYVYLSPPRPAPGNRAEAERQFAQGLTAQKDLQMRQAVTAYRAAVQADPAFFEAQSNLGLAAYNTGDLPLSLSAFETALAITPDSFNARFNFALALKKANYLMDAAQELEKVLVINTGETPAHLAAVHLTLANLYSEQFHRPEAARPHYVKVLELDTHNSQATAIRYWLRDNP